MHVLKNKILRELKQLETREMTRPMEELREDTVNQVYKLSKTYHYLCKVSEDMGEHEARDEYPAERKPMF